MMHAMNTIEPASLAIEDVSHFYGARKALDGVSFSIAPSTFAVLLGLNGAGKSTLFSLITRLYAVQCGHIQIFGRDVGRELRVRQQLIQALIPADEAGLVRRARLAVIHGFSS